MTAELDVRDGTRPRGSLPSATKSRLIALVLVGGTATITGVGLYCWPTTLVAVRRGLAIAHDASGDLLIAATAVYLTAHLARVWRMKKRLFSRWTGYAAVAAGLTAAGTGAYLQLADSEASARAMIDTLHAISSLALIVLACFHGAWGLFRGPARRA